MNIGTPLNANAMRVLLCGAGELGKELVIEFQRLGVEVIAVDRCQDPSTRSRCIGRDPGRGKLR